ncbi:transcriptional regulator, TetR family [Streptosporangium canum]|uniref:Transcriptional regulator, TetR family n=1 Tax=Streptosporangium canum TaxID=324952 RepID=A0A1I4DJW8_9ACTN|nr:TetR/AcrR family transcriptional regulator [Streptosporangium canum]SFK93914.1 transcriptional regulator, TetR family [Streptosporangium canum]
MDVSPGTLRPGGRTARVREAVLEATQDALGEHGFHGLNMDRIADRAGVGKTTVYRRWGGPIGLITDLMTDLADRSVAHADTGDLEADLLENATSVLDALTDPRLGATFQAMIAAATCDNAAATALHQFYARRIGEWARRVELAVHRGELPAGTDSADVIRAISAPLYYRTVVSREPVDARTAARAVVVALAAARAGAFVDNRG